VVLDADHGDEIELRLEEIDVLLFGGEQVLEQRLASRLWMMSAARGRQPPQRGRASIAW